MKLYDRILVSGDRNWSNRDAIAFHLRLLSHSGTTIIHGGARGADTIAGEVALELGLFVSVFEADWGRYGRAAGPVRNREMLKAKPNLVLAFHHDIWGSSKGTRDMVQRALAAGLPVRIVVDNDHWNDIEPGYEPELPIFRGRRSR